MKDSIEPRPSSSSNAGGSSEHALMDVRVKILAGCILVLLIVEFFGFLNFKADVQSFEARLKSAQDDYQGKLDNQGVEGIRTRQHDLETCLGKVSGALKDLPAVKNSTQRPPAVDVRALASKIDAILNSPPCLKSGSPQR
jgi:hypothetical protein